MAREAESVAREAESVAREAESVAQKWVRQMGLIPQCLFAGHRYWIFFLFASDL